MWAQVTSYYLGTRIAGANVLVLGVGLRVDGLRLAESQGGVFRIETLNPKPHRKP